MIGPPPERAFSFGQRSATAATFARPMALKTLKPRVKEAPGRLKVSGANPLATPRLRGRAAVERRARWLRNHPLCVDCQDEGRVTAGQEVDHIVPLWKGGADDESNLATRCILHHNVKTAAEARERALTFPS